MCPANEIAALLLECSAVPALAGVVIMLSLSVLSAANCVFWPGRLLFYAMVMFLLFLSFFFSLCVGNLCLSAQSFPEITREWTAKLCCLFNVYTSSQWANLNHYQSFKLRIVHIYKCCQHRFSTLAQSEACQSFFCNTTAALHHILN